jgi:hypothetical protein
MVDVFARSILAGKNLGFPRARDAVIASEVSWSMLNDAIENDPPARGTPEEMQQILEHRRQMVNGFGLPVRTKEQDAPLVQVQAAAYVGTDAFVRPSKRSERPAARLSPLNAT